jgi:Ribosomal protein S21
MAEVRLHDGESIENALRRFKRQVLHGVLVQTDPIVDDGRMQPFGPVEALFKGRHFDGQIIVLCVSWYTSFKLSLRDLVIMMADRSITLTHTTILRWVQHYLPEFEKRWSRYARPVWGILEDGRDIYKG